MKNILILYPKEFNCKSKFERKVSTLVKNLDEYSLLYKDDFNDFINDFAKKNEVSIKNIKTIDTQEITHSIIFDDGEEFTKELEIINKYKIPKRVIKINITRVINIKDDHRYSKDCNEYEYIGRGSYWGNPYSIFDSENDDREDVIRKFEYDFSYDMFLNKKKNEVHKLAGKRLGCFCKPKACHGDVLANFLNSYDDGK